MQRNVMYVVNSFYRIMIAIMEKVFNRMNIRAIDMNGYTFTDDDYDLCGDCAVSLNEWLESQGVDNAEAR